MTKKREESYYFEFMKVFFESFIFVFILLFTFFLMAEDWISGTHIESVGEITRLKRTQGKKQLKRAKKRLSQLNLAYRSVHLKYLSCYKELKGLLAKQKSFLKRAQINLDLSSETLALPEGVSLEIKNQHKKILKKCEKKQKNYEFLLKKIKKAQIDYLKLIPKDSSGFIRNRVSMVESIRARIDLFQSISKRSLIKQSKEFFKTEYCKELYHIKYIKRNAYEDPTVEKYGCPPLIDDEMP